MKAFAELYAELDATTSSNAKLAAMQHYFAQAAPEDAAWAVYFLSGGRPRQLVPVRILRELAEGATRLRVGLRPDGRAPMREGTALFAGEDAAGTVTSGGFGPSVEAPVAMGYVPTALSTPGTRLEGEVRGKRLPVTVAALPFVTTTYKR